MKPTRIKLTIEADVWWDNGPSSRIDDYGDLIEWVPHFRNRLINGNQGQLKIDNIKIYKAKIN